MKHLFSEFMVVFFTLGWSFLAKAQDPHFSQFYANPLYTNPATTGVTYSENGGRASLNYRNQWEGRYITSSTSWDQEFKKLKGGLGLMMFKDAAGEGLITSKSLSALYAFKQKLGEKLNLNFGIQAEFCQKSGDWKRLRFVNQTPLKGFVNPTAEPYIWGTNNNFNFSAGVLAHQPKYFLGAALHNIIEPNVSITGEPHNIWPRRLTIHGGFNFMFKNSDKLQISPQILFMHQDQFQQINGGILTSYSWVTIGFFYRQVSGKKVNPADIIGVIGIRSKKWRFAYSYDKVISEAAPTIVGSHEISLGFAYCRKKTSTEMHKGVMW